MKIGIRHFLFASAACALLMAGTRAEAAAIITNGTVTLGVNDEGHLNVGGGAPSSGTGTTDVGLRYNPTGAEATAPGCLCEGWGAGATDSSLSPFSGFANVAVDGVQNLTLSSFTSTASTATSVVTIANGVTPSLQVTHAYAPSAATPNLYQVDVTIKNIGPDALTDVRYRRVMDWDAEPTAFSEYVTIQGTAAAANVLFASNNGFASANPFAGPSDLGATGDFTNVGVLDHGALFDFGFGGLAVGAELAFKIFYGAAGTMAGALAALGAVAAEVYSLGIPSGFSPTDPSFGEPNVFIFGFAGVGGEVQIPIPEPFALLLFGTALAGLGLVRRKAA